MIIQLYKSAGLRWQHLQWHSAYSDSFRSKFRFPYTKNRWLEWHSLSVTLFPRHNNVTLSGQTRIQRSAKVFFLGCVTRPHAQRRVTQPRKNTLADLCTSLTGLRQISIPGSKFLSEILRSPEIILTPGSKSFHLRSTMSRRDTSPSPAWAPPATCTSSANAGPRPAQELQDNNSTNSHGKNTHAK